MKIIEHKSNSYAPRTYHNAHTADLTLALATDFNTAGEKLTHKAAGKKYVGIPLNISNIEASRLLYKACKVLDVRTLNVAGNGIYTLKLEGWSQETINAWVFEMIKRVHDHHPLESIISGGQTGIDLAGGVAGETLGIETVMTFPNGFRQRLIDGRDITQTAIDVENDVKRHVDILKKEKSL